jgi:hypothetical protein
MGIKERLAVVEAKLGIESPLDSGPIIVWDDDILDGGLFPQRFNKDDDAYDCAGDYEHFAYLTPDIVAAIKALPEGEK